jgi:hypothetical protein
MSLVLLFGGGVAPSGAYIAIPAGALVVKGPAAPVPPVTSPTIAIPVRPMALQGYAPAVSLPGLRQPAAGALALAGRIPAVALTGGSEPPLWQPAPAALACMGYPPAVIAGPPSLPPTPESWVIIQGIDRTSMLRATQSLEVEYTLGSRGVARCEILERDKRINTAAAYRPLVDHTIALTHGGVTLFNGTIMAVDDRAAVDPRFGVVTAVGATDFARVLAQRLINYTYPAGNLLKGIVSHLVSTWLNVYNITLDPAMTNGPTLEEQRFDFVSAETALNHLAAISGWVWRIRPDKVLEMFAPGVKTAPFALSPVNANIRGGVTWSKARTKYVNRQLVRYGTETQVEKGDTFIANPSQSSYTLTYGALVANRGYIEVDTVFTPIGPGTNWITTPTELQAVVAPPAGTVIHIDYTVQGPLIAEYADAAEVMAYGPFEDIIDMPDTWEKAAAEEFAESLVRSYKTLPRTLTIRTRAGFVLPGTTMTISVPERLVSGEWLVTAVRIREEIDQELLYEYSCLEGVEQQSSWLDFWRQVLGEPSLVKAVSGSVSGDVIPNAAGSFAGPVSAQGPPNAWAANFTADANTGQSLGLRVQGGTTTADYALRVINADDTVALLVVRGDGVCQIGTQVTGNTGLGDIVLRNGSDVRSVNGIGDSTITMVALNSSNQVVLAGEGHDIRWGRPALATGGGTGAVLGTLGSGPTTAAQAAWLRVVTSAGSVVYLPVWT